MRKIKKTKKASFDQISKNIKSLFLELSREEILESTSIDQVQAFLDEVQNNISIQKTILEHMESIRLLRQKKEGSGDRGKKNKGPQLKGSSTNTKQRTSRAKKMASGNDEWIDDGPLSLAEAIVKEEYFEDDTPKKARRSRGTQQVMFN